MERVTNNPIIRGTKRPDTKPTKVTLLRRLQTAINTAQEARAALEAGNTVYHDEILVASGDAYKGLRRLREMVEELPGPKRQR